MSRHKRRRDWTTNSDPPEESEDDAPFVRTTRSTIPTDQSSVMHIGNAWIGGNYHGNPRGDFAFDIQGERGSMDCVASRGYAVALGNNHKASGLESIAIGNACAATEEMACAIGFNCAAENVRAVALGVDASAGGDSALAVGYDAAATIRNAVALGHSATASASRAVAIGFDAAARVAYTANIGAAIIARRGEPSAIEIPQWLSCYAGAEICFFSDLLDLKSVADYEAALPTNCRLWLNEVGVILTHLVDLVSQPTIRFGVTGNYAKQLTPVATVKLTAIGKRERYSAAVPEDADASCTFGVVVAANATEFKGRAYGKGLLVENEE